MAQVEKNMAEAGSTATPVEARSEVQVSNIPKTALRAESSVVNRPVQRLKPSIEEVTANAAINDDKERLQKAQQLENLKGIQLITPEGETTPKGQAVLAAHEVGLGKADVYNYTFGQIREKAEILRKAGFNEEQTRALLEHGIAGAFEKLRAAAKKSKNKQAAETVAYAAAAGSAFIASDSEITKLVTDSTKELERVLCPQTEAKQKELECVLYFVKDDISRIYTEASKKVSQTESEAWYGTPKIPTIDEKIKVVHEALDNYKETFWTYGEKVFKKVFEEAGIPFSSIIALREEYGDIGSFIASKVAVAIEKEVRGVQPSISKKDEEELVRMPAAARRAAFQVLPEYHNIENIDDFILLDIKGELLATRGLRERERREKRKRATANERLHYSDWRERFDFTWAETPEELDDSIDDWLEYFQNALPQEIEDAMYQEVQKGLASALAAFEKAANRIGIDPAAIVAEALRDKIQSHVKKISGARLVDSKKGMEYFLKLKQDLAAKYDAYEDATYLREGFAIIADKIAEDDGAYYKGGPPDIHKPLPGETRAYRDKLRREIIEYGATHQLYITREDFENAELGKAEIRREEMQRAIAHNARPENKTKQLTMRDVEKAVIQRMDERRDRGERGGRYGSDDPIEELLLFDRRGIAAALELTDPERTVALVRVKLRTDVFKGIKEMLDKMDITDEERATGITHGLDGLTSEQRRQRIRNRIRTEMDKRKAGVRREEIDDFDEQVSETYQVTYRTLYNTLQRLNLSAAEIQTAINSRIAANPVLQNKIQQEIQAVKDKALWEWVEEYNRPRLAMKENVSDALPWFPSLWDEERLLIGKPEDLIDRRLTKEEFKAMVEKIDDPYEGMTDRQISRLIRGQFEEVTKHEVLVKSLPPDKEQAEYERLLAEREKDIREKIESVLFERKQRIIKATRNFNMNVDDDKFKGLEARWGGLTSRVVDPETGGLILTTVYAEAFKILKAKKEVDKQAVERELREWELGYVATHPGITAAEIAAAEVRERKNYKDKSLNLNLTDVQIDEHIEAWKRGYKAVYNPTDQELKEVRAEQRRLLRRDRTFATVLGLEEIGLADFLPIALYYGYSDESLIGAFAPLVGYTDDDKGELPELLDRPRKEMEAVWYFMGQQHMDGKVLEVVDRKPGLIVKDKDGNIRPAHEERWVRARVINPGGNLKLRGIFEMMFMISTSGGVEVAPLAARVGQLGVWDEGLENGQEDKLRLHGFLKRRCRWEYQQQSFLNRREWADPLTYVDRLAGAYEARKYLVGGEVQGKGRLPGLLIEPMSGAYKYRDMFFDRSTWLEDSTVKGELRMADPQMAKRVRAELRKLDNIKQIDPKVLDKLVEIGAGILKPLIDYMDSRRYLMNRAGLAPMNWKYDNELIVNAYINELFNEDIMGGEDLGFAPEGRSPIAAAIFKNILRTSTYHTLVEKHEKVLYRRAAEVKLAMDKQRTDLAVELLPHAVQVATRNDINTKRATLEESQKSTREQLDKKKPELAAKYAPCKTRCDNLRQQMERQGKSKEEIDQAVEDVLMKEYYQPNVNLIREVQNLQEQLIESSKQSENEISRDVVDTALSEALHEQLASPRDPITNPLNFNLPPEILRMLNNRWKFLLDHHVQGKTTKKDGPKGVKPGTSNIEAELKRMIDQYIDTKLHMEFVGEWPARLLAV